MKKVIAILIAVMMVCTIFTACGAPAPAASAEASAAATEAAKATEEAKASEAAGGGDNLAESIALWDAAVKDQKTTDNQLLMPDPIEKKFPDRPEDPATLAEDVAGHYYDQEYVGWDAGKKSDQLPQSPKDGSKGKKIIVIVHGDHAWTNANMKGWEQACEALGMTCEILSPNWDPALQDQLIDQAINAKPDAIALIPLSAENATQQFRKITQAGIPAFGYNTLTTSDAMPYMEAWTGPDDWAQMRGLADTLGEAMGGKGGVAYITHNVGTSPYYARTYGPITQLKEKYPEIKALDVQSPGFEAAKVKQVVADWITRFGD
ncbi:MAG: sugar ABC transporter substrate-binding protein, partial [Christensenella sp.]